MQLQSVDDACSPFLTLREWLWEVGFLDFLTAPMRRCLSMNLGPDPVLMEELLVRSRQATVSMRLGAWLASGKLTSLSGLRATSGTTNRLEPNL